MKMFEMKKYLIILMAILIILAFFSIYLTSPTGFIISIFSKPPEIINASVDPIKVEPSDWMIIRAEIKDEYGIESVKADMAGIETINLSLVEGNATHGVYQATWFVHSVEVGKTYNATIIARNIKGKESFVKVEFHDDPTLCCRYQINISNPGAAISNYEAVITINTSGPISRNIMRPDCGDIRITDSRSFDTALWQSNFSYWIWDNVTNYQSLSYWWGNTRCNSPTTKITVKIPYIPANSNKTIFVYFGNPQLSSISNFTSIFTDSVTILSATLPSGRGVLSCAPYGDSIYCFGGLNDSGSDLNQIVRYNVTSNNVTIMSATLPTERNSLSCAPYGDSIYCFGGFNISSPYYLDQIVRYNITSNTITTMSATLPTGRWGLSCAPYGDSIYCFGGWNGSHLNQIVRYNVTSNNVTIMSATLPSGRSFLSCVPYGDSIYCFGGLNGSSRFDQIVRYNVTSNNITIMSATLPSGRSGLSCAPYGDSIYCFGGWNGSLLNQIVRYNVTSNNVTIMSATLPSGRSELSCAPYGDSIYCFGGYNGSGHLDQIVRYGKINSGYELNVQSFPMESWIRISGGGGSLLITGGVGGVLKIK
ncbi:MAG: DUF2341 domain-containing protein [Candidatus Aenigmatarchaeota archaeon]